MSSESYFTLRQANEALPRLHHLFMTILQVRGLLRSLYEKLDDAGFAPEEDEEDEVPEDAPPDVARDRARFYALVETLREHVEDVQDTGCVIRDLDTGSVDWRARSGQADVWLNWQFGEPEVKFYHDEYTDVSERRPVSELEAPTER